MRTRHLILAVLHYLSVALITLGHITVQVLGAADALITAAIGTRRIAYISGQLRDAVRETRKENL